MCPADIGELYVSHFIRKTAGPAGSTALFRSSKGRVGFTDVDSVEVTSLINRGLRIRYVGDYEGEHTDSEIA